MLRWRLLSAGIILAILLALAWLDWRRVYFGVDGIWLLPILLLTAFLATEEVLSLLAERNYHPVAWPVYLGTLAIVLASCWPMVVEFKLVSSAADSRWLQASLPGIALALAVIASFAAEIQRYKPAGQSFLNIALAIFTLVYVGLLLSFVGAIRLHHSGNWGMAALVSVLLIVKFADTGAYFTGRLLGRTKMSPLLSPKKTVEGAVGGFVFAAFATWAFFQFLVPWLVGDSTVAMPATWRWLTYSALITAAGMIGDLGESLLKREMGRKDSSTWLPGLGGVLDVIDSVLIAAPVALLCWQLKLIGP